MNKLILLCLGSLVDAQERNLQIDITPGLQVDLPNISSDAFISTGFLQEMMKTEIDLEGNEHKELWLEVQWKSGGEKMYDQYQVQNYL